MQYSVSDSHDFLDNKVGDVMLLGWESNTSIIWQKSAKVEGGNLSLRVGSPLSVRNTGNVYMYVCIYVCMNKPHISVKSLCNVV